MPLSPTRCMARHPNQPWYCTVLVPSGEFEHKGPHGWDYAKGEKAIMTDREVEEELRAGGLPLLAERHAELTALDEER